MARHVSKKQAVINLLSEIENAINGNNVDIAIPILNWTKTKIDLAYQENIRAKKPRHVKRGTVYYANLGKNVGSEQNGYRPVLVVQEPDNNTKSPTVIIVPLTDAYDRDGNLKKVHKTHVPVTHPGLSKPSIIKTEYLRSISKNRLRDEVCTFDSTIMQDVEDKLKIGLLIP